MFCGIIFIDDSGLKFVNHINVAEISLIKFNNPKNIEEGTILHMRNGDILWTPETMDRLAPRIKETWNEAAILIYTEICVRMKIEEEKELKIKKARTVKRTRKK